MTKNFRLSFFLAMAFSCVMIAWNTLANFFNGVGVNFVALLCVVGVLLYFILTDSFVKSRIMDIFVLAAILAIMEFVVYIVFEFGSKSVKVYEVFSQFQIFLSILGILFLAYTIFRYVTEEKGVKIGFIETILGNGTAKPKKAKANKELVNGSLEEKPNHKAQEPEEEVVLVDEEQTEV